MTAGKLDIVIEQGATFDITLLLQNDDGTPLGGMTGWTGRGQIRPTATSPNDQTPFTVSVDSGASSVRVKMDAATTAAIAVTTQAKAQRHVTQYAYDVELVQPDLTVWRLLEGVANVSPEVTR